MKKDKDGLPVPETLGEYITFVRALGGPNTEAVQLLEEWLALPDCSPDSKPKYSDDIMRQVLLPRLRRPRTDAPLLTDPKTHKRVLH